VSGLNVVAQDITAGQADIKATGMERGLMAAYQKATGPWVKTFYRRNYAQAVSRSTTMVFYMLIYIGIPAYGAILFVQGKFTIGLILACMQAANTVTGPLRGLQDLTARFAVIRVSFRRVREMLDIPGERTGGKPVKIQQDAPVVDFSHVNFSYKDRTVIDDFTVQIQEGQFVALVGQSGSGKSTALRLIAGLYDVTDGDLRFCGNQISSLDLQSLRSYMAFVPQDGFVFPGSIKENLLCGENHSDDELREVVRKAQLSDWIASQENDWDTAAGEHGAILSGGLKQRVLIARALLRKPKVMLLDEPTSALDSGTEKKIMESLYQLKGKTTCVMVAHRLSSVTEADVILAMKEGRIIESGTHEQLMKKHGYYYDLYMLHQGGEGA